MTTGGFSSKRLARVRELLERHVDSGFVPGAVAVLARHGEVQVEARGNLAFEGAGSRTPMAGDTICRMGSMTKPIVAVASIMRTSPVDPIAARTFGCARTFFRVRLLEGRRSQPGSVPPVGERDQMRPRPVDLDQSGPW